MKINGKHIVVIESDIDKNDVPFIELVTINGTYHIDFEKGSRNSYEMQNKCSELYDAMNMDRIASTYGFKKGPHKVFVELPEFEMD